MITQLAITIVYGDVLKWLLCRKRHRRSKYLSVNWKIGFSLLSYYYYSFDQNMKVLINEL